MIKVKTKKEIEIMKEGGRILRKTLKILRKSTKVGMSYEEINTLTERLLKEKGAKAASKGYDGFPGNLCISKNEEVVHGIPFGKKFKDGDLINFDLMIKYKGMFTDASDSFVLGKSNEKKDNLIKITRLCLDEGIKEAKVGNKVGDIGYAIQSFAEKNGYSVVRDLVGHGVGYELHEDPIVPNYGSKGTREKLKAGMTLAIEPMLCVGDYELIIDRDGWTYKTADGGLSCQMEHTVLVSKKGGEIIT